MQLQMPTIPKKRRGGKKDKKPDGRPARSRYAATFPTVLKRRKLRNMTRHCQMTLPAAKLKWESKRKHLRQEPKRRNKVASPIPVYLDLSYGNRR